MANRTDLSAKIIHDTNPQNLVEKILRSKIYQNRYWKEQCFGLTAATLLVKAIEIDHLGGTYGGNRKPTPFMCLVMKMLQIQPEKNIAVEFIKNGRYKYVRILGAFYLRLTGTVMDVYQYLEPLYNDKQKLRRKLPDGSFSLTHVDEVIDELLTKDYSCDIALPRVLKRLTLEATDALEPRRSALEDDFEEEEKEDDDRAMGTEAGEYEKDHHHGRNPIRERDRNRRRDSHKYRDRDYDWDRDYDQDYGRGCNRDRDRYRDRDRERDRYRHRTRDDMDYARDGERDRRDWVRGRRRSCSKSRSHSRERNHEDGDHRRRRHDRRSVSPCKRPEQDVQEPKKMKEKVTDGTNHPDPEIAEANRLRASLGLKPLKM